MRGPRGADGTEAARLIAQVGAAALFLAVGAGLAQAQPSLLDQLFERHVRVKSAAGGGVLHLLYERKADPQAPPSSCYRRYAPAKGWLDEERLQGAHRCVAFLDNALYVFRRDNYSVYRTADWRAPRIFRNEDGTHGEPRSEWHSHAWPLPWPPDAACRVGEELWLLGVEAASGTKQIRVASVRAGSERSPTVLGKPLATPSPPSDVSALPASPGAIVFWHEGAVGRGTELWRASFDGEVWGTPESVPAPYPSNDYATAQHDGGVWLMCKARGERIGPKHPLMVTSLVAGEWGEASPIPGVADPSSWLNWTLDKTLDIDAASLGGSLFVFRACRDSVVAHRWAEDRWSEPEVLIQLSPWPRYLFWWIVGNVALSMALLPVVGFVALRVRIRPRRPLPVLGDDVRPASWARRVAAQLVDILLGLLLCSAAVQWFGIEDVDVTERADSLLGAIALYSAIYLGYFVLSEGLTGQSFGKLLLRIAVVGPDGGPPSLCRVIVRNLLRPWPFLVPAAYLLGSIILLLTRTHQRLGDLLARTYVVDLPPLIVASPWSRGRDE